MSPVTTPSAAATLAFRWPSWGIIATSSRGPRRPKPLRLAHRHVVSAIGFDHANGVEMTPVRCIGGQPWMSNKGLDDRDRQERFPDWPGKDFPIFEFHGPRGRETASLRDRGKQGQRLVGQEVRSVHCHRSGVGTLGLVGIRSNIPRIPTEAVLVILVAPRLEKTFLDLARRHPSHEQPNVRQHVLAAVAVLLGEARRGEDSILVKDGFASEGGKEIGGAAICGSCPKRRLSG